MNMNESARLFIKVLISDFAWLLIRILGMFFVGLLIIQIYEIIYNYRTKYWDGYWYRSHELPVLIEERLSKILFFLHLN